MSGFVLGVQPGSVPLKLSSEQGSMNATQSCPAEYYRLFVGGASILVDGAGYLSFLCARGVCGLDLRSTKISSRTQDAAVNSDYST